ncbi:excisionase family DNA-binding protein [Actimicrobium sp. CCI2.3]|uniref:excisionase family DNA-binding protein n=1 Tax=Actimicrobium sp. CCI2.3 TaxID=3048616 RepID=UPI002AB39965|nr:excisionase family DNA-binding protein [Actimicrobium sp. CCI2.3]MDY7576215.1 excisionase family DNA-binding protein [Actimicrobium sp. CCI2.3]MEB0020580.1 excisionase family DNA-binding protein [Actimicrobium sp. CCI2.3]
METIVHLSDDKEDRALEDIFIKVRRLLSSTNHADIATLDTDEVAEKLASVFVIEGKKQPVNKGLTKERLAEAKKKVDNYFESLNSDAPVEDTGLSPNEAAELLRMSRGTLNKMLADGSLNFRTWSVGSNKRISKNDVTTYWDGLMRKLDPIKAELVEEARKAGMYEKYSSSTNAQKTKSPD